MGKPKCPVGRRYGKGKVTQYGGVYTSVQKIRKGEKDKCFSHVNAVRKANFLINTMCGKGIWSQKKCATQKRAAQRYGYRK